MKHFIQFAIGYMVILILDKGIIVQTHTCKIIQEGNYKTAECINEKSLLNVPQDLDKTIEKLDLSGSRVTEINGDSFKEYSNLLILKCENIQLTTQITDKYLFKSLKKLREVYFKGMNLSEASTFHWPNSIKIIHISNCMIQKLNLENAAHLKELDASSNNLQDIPVFSELAPIQYVNLKENPLGGATVASLARACRVNHLDLSLIGNSDLKSQKLFCTCKEILNWIAEFKIKSNVMKEEETFKCNPYAENDAKCEKKLPPAALKLREDCLAKSREAFSFIMILIVIFIGTVFVLFSLCLFAYLYGSLLEKKEAGEVIEIHRGDTTSAFSEELPVEEEENLL